VPLSTHALLCSSLCRARARPYKRSMVHRASLALLALLTAGSLPAQALDPPCRAALAAASAGRTFEAGRCTDPAAATAITWLKLQSGPATAEEFARLLTDHPDWPARPTLLRRAEELHATLQDDAAVRRWFAQHPPQTPLGRLRFAEALDATGRASEALAQRRAAWVELPSNASDERAFLERWGNQLRPEDHAARADRLAWVRDTEGLRRLLPRLDARDQAVARARLEALAGSEGEFGFTPELRRDPIVFLERARALRRQDRDLEAARFWLEAGEAAQRAAGEARLQAFWDERQIVIRRLIRLREAPLADRLATAHDLPSRDTVAFLEAEFLAGWIALRRAGDPQRALNHFAALERVATAPISRARGAYWRGRALLAAGREAEARAAYVEAARFPFTFYGQLGALAAGESEADLRGRIRSASDPLPGPDHAALWERRDLARAASLLAEIGDARRARQILLRLADLAPDDGDRALAARLAVRLGQPDTAVWVARRVQARHGTVLPETGWPAPYVPPPGIDAPLALALMRQESNFDVAAVSPAGARGLMQVMPATARAMARELGEPSLANRLFEPLPNMTLGTAYLAKRLEEFDRAIPLALAAYNAGAHRVRQWLGQYGDPRLGEIDPLDWIELIPFPETRNYVMRVVESVTIYEARAGGQGSPHPVLAMRR